MTAVSQRVKAIEEAIKDVMPKDNFSVRLAANGEQYLTAEGLHDGEFFCFDTSLAELAKDLERVLP